MFSWQRVRTDYHQFFHDTRRERLFLSSLSFFSTFAVTRALAHAVHNKVGPFRDVSTGGTHIHHSFWGICTLLGTSYARSLEIDAGTRGSRHGRRAVALLYGAGAALTLDEYALWLKLQSDYKIRDDDYWQGGGRKSIYAVGMFGSLLLLTTARLSFVPGDRDADADNDRPDHAG